MVEGFLARSEIRTLLDLLLEAGYRCIGPQLRDGAIVYENLARVEDLPQGVRMNQGPGRCSAKEGHDARFFAWANGPQALKPLLFAPRETLWRAEHAGAGHFQLVGARGEAEPLAVIGVRACDLAALRLQDQHFLEQAYADPYYGDRRAKLFLVAVHCTHPSETCFCVSTGDGPSARHGFDLALHELDDGFLVQSASDKGEVIGQRLRFRPPTRAQRLRAERQIFHAAKCQQRRLPSRDLRDILFANLQHARWQEVGDRCLSCGNCTSVCPTCFCHSEAEQPSLDGSRSEHVRQWDSCFTQGHSYIHGITIRAETRMRYRQWLTHKLGSWHDQYGRSGCVGCGRCIVWCPVGIDITEEAGAICAEAAHD